MIDPQRGEVWWVELDPTRGAEIQKTRPVVVLSPHDTGRSTLRIVAPVIGWKTHFKVLPWMVELAPDAANGLTKPSGVDTSQLRAVDLERFGSQLGTLPDTDMALITLAAQISIGAVIPPPTASPPSSS